jgi:SAM-dependent methyltransferase/uncharacterized protein YbaR (Trm112 family)
MNRIQSAVNKKAEIEFRKKLVQQQVSGAQVLKDEYSSLEIERILKERMDTTFKQVDKLEQQGFVLSPYIEIGAERCQRSLVMENDLNISGAAVDISFDMLKSCEYYSERFNKNRIPLRVCCDAYNLPFISNSIPFVFCYETLHHFPDPLPIVREVFRVLSPGGLFLFDEEPYKQILHFKLYESDRIYSTKSLNKNRLRKLFDYFLSEAPCNEIEHGIIENHDISIDDWRSILEVFQQKNVRLESLKYIKSELYEPRSQLKFHIARLCGGELSGTCVKPGSCESPAMTINDAIICPSCRRVGEELKLVKMERHLYCVNCKSTFPEIDNILFMLCPDQLNELYPSIAVAQD